MSDTQIIQYFQNTPGRICGRFANDQLEQPLAPIVPGKKQHWWVALAMPLALLFNKAMGQANVATKKSYAEVTQGKPVLIKPDHRKGRVRTTTIRQSVKQDSVIIEGSIIDEESKPLPFATIFVYPERKIIHPDSAGRFSYVVPPVGNTKELRFTAAGYGQEALALANRKDDKPVIVLKKKNTPDEGKVPQIEETIIYGVGGIIATPVKSKKSFIEDALQFRRVLPSAFNISPNPAQPGSQVMVNVKKAGEYTILLNDNNGRLISSKPFDATKENTVTAFDIPSNLSAAMYYVVLVNERTRNSNSVKLIVQKNK